MKAVFALLIIYVGAFLVAIQGSSPSTAQAAPQATPSKQNASTTSAIDSAKESDIRALLELVGAHDQVQDSVRISAEQYREKLLLSVKNNDQGQEFVNSVITQYEKNFNVDQVTEHLVVLYDKHYTDDEIKALLQFYGSPLGQKVAAEAPKIAREIQETTRTVAAQAAKDALVQGKQENPGVGQNARFGNGQGRRLQQRRQQQTTQDAGQQTAQQQDRR